jgi:hypothetical protein
MQLGPPLRIRFNENEASNLIEKAGFSVDEVKEEGLYHYMMVATPKS